MQLDQVLTSNEFIRVAHVEHLALGLLSLEILCVEIRGHLTLDLYALDFSEITLVLKILPIGFVEFRPNQEV